MSWDRLPFEIYVHIFKNLNFWDRKPLSLVCQRWNEVIFSRALCRNLCIELSRGDWSKNSNGGDDIENVRVLDEGVVETSHRDYRVVYVKWCKDSSSSVFNSIDRLLRGLSDKFQLEGMIIDAPLGQHLANFFRTHGDLLARIRKLQVLTECTESRLRLDRCMLKMDRLETLFWREIVPNDQLELYRPWMVLQAPNLQSAVVRLGDSDTDHGIMWHNCFLELDQCSNLNSLNIHLHARMWERFFEQQLSSLEQLTLRHKTPNLEIRDWNVMFRNMPNLKSLQMWDVNDAILEAINRHCNQLKVLLLDKVNLTRQFLLTDRVFPCLEHLRLESGEIRSNRTLCLPVLQNLEWFNVTNQDNQILNIFAPNLRYLRQAKHGQSDFILTHCVPSCLEKLQLDLYASNIPDHLFRPFPNMRDFSVRISSARPDLDRIVPNVKNINEFTLIAYNAPLQCDAMLGQMFKHCEQITSLTLCGFNPNLELSFPVFAQIFRNRNLKYLKMFGLTITGHSFPLQLPPDLDKFDLRYIKVMDVAFGAYVFPPDGPFQIVCNKTEEFCCYFSKDCD
ncbi:uncharacterized protein LOC131682347 [Topomyia yanbarensis]|uniref:uncharacterized protein LOC131682347 n=1 Tax=Topomyia yanbarensis TaxID=2498891 RepID=UPI00273B6EAB|nr:uncharacterized protein LOC131682347 [Topomyia yanbarensis]